MNLYLLFHIVLPQREAPGSLLEPNHFVRTAQKAPCVGKRSFKQHTGASIPEASVLF